jgi:hypothetical protein
MKIPRWLLLGAVWIGVSLLTGCDLKLANGTTATRQISLDGVKLIAADISNSSDATTMGQSRYKITADRRLLLRFEDLTERAMDINVTTDKKVELLTYCLDYPTCNTDAVTDLKLCPVTREWMMLATWNYAHPFGSGAWKRAGGDYEEDGCLAPINEPIDPLATEPAPLKFDIKSWVIDYAQGRKKNDGWILIPESQATFEVYGEKSGRYSPRLKFDEYL